MAAFNVQNPKNRPILCRSNVLLNQFSNFKHASSTELKSHAPTLNTCIQAPKKRHQLLLHTELATNSFHKLRVQYTSIFELVIKTLAERNGRVLRFIKRFSIDDSPAMCQTAGAFFTDFNFWPHFAAIAHVGIGFLWHLTQFETYRFEPWMCVGCVCLPSGCCVRCYT